MSKLKIARIRVGTEDFGRKPVWTVGYACTSIETHGLATVLKLHDHIVWSGHAYEVDINTLPSRQGSSNEAPKR